jgi:hypothetical protein
MHFRQGKNIELKQHSNFILIILIFSQEFEEKMKCRYRLFVFTSLFINFVCWWYVIIFCGIYTTSTSGWIQGSIIGLVIDWCGISLAVPLIKTTIRILIRKYPHFKFLIILDYTFFLVGLFC